MGVISKQQFLDKACKVVSIPGFDLGETIEVRLKKVSILGLASKGKIPNVLMGTVNNVFGEQMTSKKAQQISEKAVNNDLASMSKLLDIVCEQAMVEPTYEEVGDCLTDDQKNAIFEFTQGGVKQLMPSDTK